MALGLVVVAPSCTSTAGGAGVALTPPPAGAPACPVAAVAVVVSVDQWSELVRTVGGACARVTTIVSGTTGDPHDYEPTPVAVQSFASARVVVVDGLGYDDWAAKAAASSPAHPATIDAGAVAGKVAGDNPHLWYSPTAVAQVADAVAARLVTALGPGAAAYIAARRAEWAAAMAPVVTRIAALTGALSGRRYAATESVYAYTLEALGLVDVTPTGYRRAAANESEPAPADVQAFDELLRPGGVDVLVYNTQTQGAVTSQLRATAEARRIPVLEVTETVPASAGGSFVAWQLDQLSRLSTLVVHA